MHENMTSTWTGLYAESSVFKIWAAEPQNQQNGMCAQQRFKSAWASAQSDHSSLSAWRKLGSLPTHWAHSEDSDQTGWMPRLIWVFAGRSHFVGSAMRQLICRPWSIQINWCVFWKFSFFITLFLNITVVIRVTDMIFLCIHILLHPS